MRILVHHRIASCDGQAVHIEELIAALQRQGHETILVGPPSLTTTRFGGSKPLVDRIKRSIPEALYELLEAPSAKTAIIQQIHIIGAHIVCALVERKMFPRD